MNTWNKLNSGLYIVTLNNEVPISVNAHDPRKADTCIKVTREHCKFGQTDNFDRRKKDYIKTFGEENVNFRPFVELVEFIAAENLIKRELVPFMILGPTGRKNEWLSGVGIGTLEKIILNTLDNANLIYRRLS